MEEVVTGHALRSVHSVIWTYCVYQRVVSAEHLCKFFFCHRRGRVARFEIKESAVMHVDLFRPPISRERKLVGESKYAYVCALSQKLFCRVVTQKTCSAADKYVFKFMFLLGWTLLVIFHIYTSKIYFLFSLSKFFFFLYDVHIAVSREEVVFALVVRIVPYLCKERYVL